MDCPRNDGEMSYTRQQYDDIYRFVACMLRAERERGPASEEAAHTRLKCLDLARERGIDGRCLLNFREHRDVGDWTIDGASAPYWDDVAHPSLLVAEVHEA